MGLLDRISRLVRANFSQAVSGAEDPEKVLQQAVIEMQSDLVLLRQAVAQAIATQKRTERQSEQAARTAQEWYSRAQLALQKGEEPIARDALTRRQTYAQNAHRLSAQITEQKDIVQRLKANMNTLEGKIADARTRKDMHIARARAAQSSARINEMIGQIGTAGALGAFERMETRVLDLEAQAEALDELNSSSVEGQFAQLEAQAAGQNAAGQNAAGQSAIDAQLAEMQANLLEDPS